MLVTMQEIAALPDGYTESQQAPLLQRLQTQSDTYDADVEALDAARWWTKGSGLRAAFLLAYCQAQRNMGEPGGGTAWTPGSRTRIDRRVLAAGAGYRRDDADAQQNDRTHPDPLRGQAGQMRAIGQTSYQHHDAYEIDP